jgi:PEP-CTERM motif
MILGTSQFSVDRLGLGDDVMSMLRRFSVLLLLALASGISGLRAELYFSEPFSYQVGSSLDGLNGGSGFSGAWSGGNSTIVSGLGGSGGAVNIGTDASARSLLNPVDTAGKNIYLSYLMNASSFSGGNYTGISLYDGGNEMPFFGIPWDAQNFGFDGHNSTPIQTINFTPLVDTTYLIIFGLLSNPSGKLSLDMWATSNLFMNPDVMIGGTPNAQLNDALDNFSFDSIQVHGNYESALKISGIASASSPSEAVSATLQSVPEPSTYALFGLGALGLVVVARHKRS